MNGWACEVGDLTRYRAMLGYPIERASVEQVDANAAAVDALLGWLLEPVGTVHVPAWSARYGVVAMPARDGEMASMERAHLNTYTWSSGESGHGCMLDGVPVVVLGPRRGVRAAVAIAVLRGGE